MGVLRVRMVREMSLREFSASTQKLYLATEPDEEAGDSEASADGSGQRRRRRVSAPSAPFRRVALVRRSADVPSLEVVPAVPQPATRRVTIDGVADQIEVSALLHDHVQCQMPRRREQPPREAAEHRAERVGRPDEHLGEVP